MFDDLLINPYAKAEIVYAYGRVINAPEERFARSTQQTTDGTFRLTCNSDGTMNIHRYGSRRDNEYVLGIVCGGETLQRIAIDKRQVRVLYNYWLTVDGLMQRRMDDELMENVEYLEEELANKPKIELRLKECNEVQRVDLRFAKQWITLTFFKQVLINVRMNGDFFCRQLWFLCADTRRRPLDFSRGFQRGEDNVDELTNSEESDEDLRIGNRPLSRQSSARTSLRSTRSMTQPTSGPPPIEERENPEVIQKRLNRTRLLANLSHTVRAAEPIRPASRIGNLYQIDQYTPPRRIDLPLTMPQTDRPLVNAPSTEMAAAIPPIDLPMTKNATPNTSTAVMTEARNDENVEPVQNTEPVESTKTKEKKSKKAGKSKLSAKSVQKAILQAIASINLEQSDDSD